MPSCSSCPPLAETVTVGQALETVTHFLDLIQHLHLLFFSNAQLQQLSPTGWNSHSRASIGSGHTLFRSDPASYMKKWKKQFAHWAGKVPGWGPAVHTELGSWRRAWRRVGKAEVEVEVDADMVEEARRRRRRTRTRMARRRRATTLIKSNNPHLAGGELRIRSSTESSVRWGSEQDSLQGDEEWYRGRSGEGLQSKDKWEKRSMQASCVIYIYILYIDNVL